MNAVADFRKSSTAPMYVAIIPSPFSNIHSLLWLFLLFCGTRGGPDQNYELAGSEVKLIFISTHHNARVVDLENSYLNNRPNSRPQASTDYPSEPFLRLG